MLLDFFHNRTGNVAMMFGLFLIPLLIGAGVAIDMLRANQVRGEMAEAADSGLLAAARAKTLDPNLTTAEVKAIARKYFDANYAQSPSIIIEEFDFSDDAATGEFDLVVRGKLKTAILGVIGNDFTPIDIFSEAAMAPGRPLEVVLVLDNTWSMNGQKITDLEDAAEDLIEALMADTNNSVLVGLVPFSTHVNIGKSRGSESWVDAPSNSSYDRNSCSVDAPAATSAGCSEQPSTCHSDGVPYSCTKWQCPGDAAAPTNCTTAPQPTTWEGCVGSRDHPLNIEDSSFATDPVPGVLNHVGDPDCPGEILPMTTDKQDVLDGIHAMSARGNTYIPGGLTWGLRLISASAPFTEGDTYANIANEEGVKAMVLMTDGDNIKSPNSNGAHYGNDVALADQNTNEMCDEIKAQDIILYTVAFDITDPTTIDLVKNCATDADSFFDAGDAAELSDAFTAIGASLTELALTK